MLIRRCAWHPKFHGYPFVHGIATWRGRSIMFTDGVCRGCAQRVRMEWELGRAWEDRPSFWMTCWQRIGVREVVLASAGACVIVLLVLSARSLVESRGERALPTVRKAPGEPALARPGPGEPRETPTMRAVASRPVPQAAGAKVRGVAGKPARVVATRISPAPPPPPPAVTSAPPAAPLPVPRRLTAASAADELSRSVVRQAAVRLLLAPRAAATADAGAAVQTP